MDAKTAQRNMALAVWDLPRQYSKDQSKFRLTGAVRFIPVRASFTHNLCGIIIADIKKGTNVITLTAATPQRTPKSLDMSLGGNIMAKVIERDGVSNAYIFTTGSKPEDFTITPPTGAECLLYKLDSDTPLKIDQSTTLTVEQVKYLHIVGLTLRPAYEELPDRQAGRSGTGRSRSAFRAGSRAVDPDKLMVW